MPPDNVEAFVRLKTATRVPICQSERVFTRFGFRPYIEKHAADIIMPDIAWCGGLTELLKIAAYADAHGVLVVPHASSVYSYHLVATRPATPFAEFLMMSPDGASVVPTYGPLLDHEPLPERGRIRVSQLDRPGFGVELNRSLDLRRPFTR